MPTSIGVFSHFMGQSAAPKAGTPLDFSPAMERAMAEQSRRYDHTDDTATTGIDNNFLQHQREAETDRHNPAYYKPHGDHVFADNMHAISDVYQKRVIQKRSATFGTAKGAPQDPATLSAYRSTKCKDQLEAYERCMTSSRNDTERCGAIWSTFSVCKDGLGRI